MKTSSLPASLRLSFSIPAVLIAAAGLATAQITQTEKKTETRTNAGGTVQTSETKVTESVLPRPGFTMVEGTVVRMDGDTNKIMIRTK